MVEAELPTEGPAGDASRSPLLGVLRRPRMARVLVLVPPVLVGALALGVSLWACPLRSLCGCRCPGCGLTRSFSALARGELPASFALHPFALVFGAAWVVLAVHQLLGPAARTRLETRIGRVETRVPLSATLMWAFLVFGAVRLVLDAYGTTRFP